MVPPTQYDVVPLIDAVGTVLTVTVVEADAVQAPLTAVTIYVPLALVLAEAIEIAAEVAVNELGHDQT
ncbi:MAG: hypothetical protein U0Y10_23230 [Spirosomataceae bacterium]